jgi:hypothetical protein
MVTSMLVARDDGGALFPHIPLTAPDSIPASSVEFASSFTLYQGLALRKGFHE